MQKFKRLFTAAGVGALALVAGANHASAATVVVSSLVDQSGYFADPQPGGGTVYPVTGAGAPYDFTGQVAGGFGAVQSIDSLTITLSSIFDGDSGPGDFAENHLFLTLDGINTGVALNGLLNNASSGITITATVDPAAQAALIAALADGKLVGGILDTSAGGPPGDPISIPFAVQTSLDLTLSGANLGNAGGGGGGGGNPVPLPAAALLAPLGAATASAFSRRFRKVK